MIILITGKILSFEKKDDLITPKVDYFHIFRSFHYMFNRTNTYHFQIEMEARRRCARFTQDVSKER